MLSILVSINEKHKLLDEVILIELKHDIFTTKMLYLRALILDLIVNDYYEDINLFDKPELWVHDIIKELKICFDLEKQPILNIFEDFIELLFDEIKSIFISKNRKMGKFGKQLILNLLFLGSFVNYYVVYDFTPVINEIILNIQPEKLIPIDEVKSILKKYKH